MSMNKKTAVLLLGCVFPLAAFAAFKGEPVMNSENPAELCTVKARPCPKVVSFMVDYSGSMMQTPKEAEAQKESPEEKKAHEKRRQRAKADLERRAKASKKPAAALMTFDEYEKTPRVDSVKKLITAVNHNRCFKCDVMAVYSASPYTVLVPYARYREKDAFDEKLSAMKDNFEVMGRRSPLGIALESQGRTLKAKNLAGRVIVFTDGDVNRGRAVARSDEEEREADETHSERGKERDGKSARRGDGPKRVPALDNFYKDNPKASVHIVSLAVTKEEKRMVLDIAGRDPRTKVFDLETLMTDDRALKRFINQAF